MADKIVQLQDQNGNNVFPICRGLGNDTVTTAAVDWSSIYETPVNIATSSITVENIVIYLQRIGNLVMWNASVPIQIASHGTNSYTSVLPAGFTPAYRTCFVLNSVDGQTNFGAWTLSNIGENIGLNDFYCICRQESNGVRRWMGSGVYITNDDWPG